VAGRGVESLLLLLLLLKMLLLLLKRCGRRVRERLGWLDLFCLLLLL
jgi:hypothetical protein